MILSQQYTDLSRVKEVLKSASVKIAPLWSLENFVAVNPFLGMADWKFEEAMNFLNKTGEVQAALPVEFYLKALETGQLREEDLTEALEGNELGISEEAETFIRNLFTTRKSSTDLRIQTLVDVASEINSKEWRRFMIDRISLWASAYFDHQQASWKTTQEAASIFAAWKQEAEIDYGTEAMGLKGFRKLVKSLPNDHLTAASLALDALQIPEEMLDHYLNALLMKMNGWAGFAARIDWDARLDGRDGQAVQEFLAILLTWELCLSKLLSYPNLASSWNQSKQESIASVPSFQMSEQLSIQLILQKAFDIALQRSIIQKINSQSLDPQARDKTKAQAVFCIDVRSEVFRRNLEATDAGIETFGFAGFFGFPVKYVPLGYEEGSNQCPVLLNTSHTVSEQLADKELEQKVLTKRRFREHLFKFWKSFRSGAISCFGFVSPLGIYFLPKLFTDLFGWTRPVAHPDQFGLSSRELSEKKISLDSELHSGIGGIPKKDRVKMAHSALTAMGLTEGFAPIVLITGHGASTVNNPHATGLDCGACGGHSGEANAKVAAAVLNDIEVRKELNSLGICIPENTVFIAALHDTTTDNVTLLNTTVELENIPEFSELREALKMAGTLSRKERAGRMGIDGTDLDKLVIGRSKDISQVRPEWGLAGCSSFIVAPRERTSRLNFGGKAFMHSYNWKKDQEFKVLEVIMTAPMVVTSWINLQYYASTVDNKKLGAGNKTLHNIVGGLGVLEGFAGDLRVGLPWQSVHDGERYQHEPNRLNVIIEAPVDEMSKILKKHDSIRQLCDNQWIYLFAMNDQGKVAYKYIGDLEWEVIR